MIMPDIFRKRLEKRIVILQTLLKKKSGTQVCNAFYTKEGQVIAQGEKSIVNEENIHQLYDTKVRQITENESTCFHPS